MNQMFPVLSRLLAGARELVLPASCAGCRRSDAGLLCGACRAALAAAEPRQVCPDPVPPGLPPCHAVGPYRGRLRQLIVAYKERGRHDLAVPLADRLAVAVMAAVPPSRPVMLVPVPTTARAIRQRRGDHMLRLARVAEVNLRGIGRAVSVIQPVRARPRPDSAGLSAAERSRFSRASLSPRRSVRIGAGSRSTRRPGVPAPAIVVLDDVITTGATIAATCDVLAGLGLCADAGVVLAATERRRPRVTHPL